ncbi:DMP19 family protein [Niabella pedocola]|uniref:DMP19 family protein n=1 Tax=Niabella pedocola TaxID=1752077 RepID=UPI00374D821A
MYAVYFRYKSGTGKTWEHLSNDEQDLAALRMLDRDMQTEGYLFFFNASNKCLYLCTQGLKRRHATEYLIVLNKLHFVYDSVKPIISDASRSDILSYLTDEELETIELYNSRYFSGSDCFNEKIVRLRLF